MLIRIGQIVDILFDVTGPGCDGALPHRRAHAKRDDVQLHRRPGPGSLPDDAEDAAGSGPVDAAVFEVVVVGGGQAGLAMAWHLAQRGVRFNVLEAAAELGQTWRSRWNSLTLFTPAQFDALPRMPFPAAGDTYPGRDDVADYQIGYQTTSTSATHAMTRSATPAESRVPASARR